MRYYVSLFRFFVFNLGVYLLWVAAMAGEDLSAKLATSWCEPPILERQVRHTSVVKVIIDFIMAW